MYTVTEMLNNQKVHCRTEFLDQFQRKIASLVPTINEDYDSNMSFYGSYKEITLSGNAEYSFLFILGKTEEPKYLK